MWDLIVSVPDHCLSFYLRDHLLFKGQIPFFASKVCNSEITFSTHIGIDVTTPFNLIS